MAAPSYTYSLTNGATADASQVMQNYNDILNGVTDGTKDLTINALTANGAASFKGTVTLGDATGDDITVTGSLASTIPIKTTNTYNIGSATLGLGGAYFGTGSTQTAKIVSTGTLAASRVYTMLDAGADANFFLSEGASTANGVKTFAGQLIGKGTAAADNAATGYIGEQTDNLLSVGNIPGLTGAYGDVATLNLTAGDWEVSGMCILIRNGATFTSTDIRLGIFSSTSQVDSVGGENESQFIAVFPITFTRLALVVPPVRVKSNGTDLTVVGVTTSSTQVIRLRLYVDAFTGGPPTVQGRISCRRLR